MRVIDGNIFAGMRMIIPEHREAMQKLEQEERRMARPVLDEQKFEELTRALHEVMQEQCQVTIQVFNPLELEEIQIVPVKIDPFTKQLKGTIAEGNSVSIPLSDIMDVRF